MIIEFSNMRNNLFKTLLSISLVVLSSSFIYGQPKPFLNQSPKPTSFEAVLSGISSYSFIVPNEQVDFIEAYYIEELRQWMEATRPGIYLGIDYTKPSSEHLYISYSFSSRRQLASNGIWWWYVNSAKVKFTVASLNYEYEFSIPNFSVEGNNFGNHIFYNHLLSRVTNKRINYNKQNTLKLANYSARTDEAKIKNIWKNEGCKLYEGIYEIVNDGNNNSPKYKLAMKYIDNKPSLIYLSGANYPSDWREGEYKAFLEPTASPNIFKAQWLMSNKTISSGFVSFDSGSMITSISEDKDTYIKLYPTASDNISVAGAQADEWSGTGFALKNGYIVTNFHVVDGAKSIIVHGVNGDTSNGFVANVVATDKTNDLAIIQIKDSRFTGFGSIPYTIRSQMADVGEDIWVLGYPLTQVLGNEIKLTNGLISSRSGYQGDISSYQISAPVQPGNSGGPLFDSKGNIVGIVNAGVPGAENVGYAIKTSYLKNLVDSYSLTSSLPTSNTISSLALKDQVKKVNNYVFLLLCSSK